MNNKIINKKLLFTGLVSLVLSSIIFSCNWSVFFKRNINSNYRKNLQINENNYSQSYSDKVRNVLFQISVLKMVITKNNSFLHNYEKVFKNNIHSFSNLNNKIGKKINIANKSIMNELVILYNIKNIIEEHPYNYLEILQNHKYYIPYISCKNNHYNNTTLNSIKTKTNEIIRKDTNINSISYQSEESLIGAGSISSFLSCTKTLIFSKVQTNFINVIYFSKYLNNLSTFNTFNNTNNSIINSHIINEDNFTDILETSNNKNISFFRNDLSKRTSTGNYIERKSYVIGLPLLAVAGIIIIIMTGGRRKSTPIRWKQREPSNSKSFEKQTLKQNTRFKKKKKEETAKFNNDNKPSESFSNQDLKELDSQVADKVYDETTILSNDDSHVMDTDSSLHRVSENIQADGAFDSKISAIPQHKKCSTPDSLMLEKQILTEYPKTDQLSTDKITQPMSQDKSIIKLIISHYSTSYFPGNNKMYDSSLGTNSAFALKGLLPKPLSVTCHTNIKHTETSMSLEKENTLSSTFLFSEQKEITSLWKEADINKYWPIIKIRVKLKNITADLSRTRISSFLYERHLSLLQNETFPNSRHIFKCVNSLLLDMWHNGLNKSSNYASRCALLHVTSFPFKRNKADWMVFTTHGWFEIPNLRHKIRSQKVTKDEYYFLQEQDMQFDHMLSLIPHLQLSPLYFKTLVNEFNTHSLEMSKTSEYSLVDRFIANEILLDLAEVIYRYKRFIDIKNKIFDDSLASREKTKIDVKNYLLYFKNTCIVSEDFGGVNDIGLDEDDIFHAIKVK